MIVVAGLAEKTVAILRLKCHEVSARDCVLMQLRVDRKCEADGRPLTAHGRQVNLASMHLDDLAADAQAVSVCVGAALGGEARIKNARDQLRCNPSTGIRDLDVNGSIR